MVVRLFQLGFSVSYNEIIRFKQCVVQCSDDITLPAYPDCFTQFAADNVDHNICTIDGLNTFHGFGLIAMSAACSGNLSVSNNWSGSLVDSPIPRLPRYKVADIIQNRGIPFEHYETPDKSALSALSFKPFEELNHLCCQPVSTNQDILWHAVWFLANEAQPRTGWAGFMHDLNADCATTLSIAADVRMYPIMDKNPNDVSSIYSVLRYITEQSNRLLIPTCCVTFDHPLWLKAVDIIHLVLLLNAGSCQ